MKRFKFVIFTDTAFRTFSAESVISAESLEDARKNLEDLFGSKLKILSVYEYAAVKEEKKEKMEYDEDDFVALDREVREGDFVKTSYGVGIVKKIFTHDEFYKDHSVMDVVGLETVFGSKSSSGGPIAYVTWKSGDYSGGGWKYWEVSNLIPLARKEKR